MARVAVVIPALNEEKVIASAVLAIPRDLVSEVIVVDNGSTDDTAQAAERAGARVVSEPVRGYGRACMRGVSSVSPDCEIIVQMDADLSVDPSEIALLIRPITEDGYDLVIGSRLLGDRETDSMSVAQVLGSVITGWMTRVLYGVRYTDMGPFRAIRRQALESLDMCEETYGWLIEMQTKAASRGLKVKEVPIHWRNRLAGESKVAGTLIGSARAAVRILWTVARLAVSEVRVNKTKRTR